MKAFSVLRIDAGGQARSGKQIRSVSVDGSSWIEIKPLFALRIMDAAGPWRGAVYGAANAGRPEIGKHARKALFLMDCRFNVQLYRMADIAGFAFVRSEEA